MRAFWQAVEAGLHTVRLCNLADGMDPEALAALHAAGLLRPTGNFDLEELSWSDLARALRALYAAEGRGLAVPGRSPEQPELLGWSRDEQGDVPVVLVARPKLQLELALSRPGRALLLVPTTRAVSKAVRTKHGAGARLRIEVLNESITCSGGRLARASLVAPDAPDLWTPPHSPAPAPPARARTSLLPVAPIPGAKHWHDIRIQNADPDRVRITLLGLTHFRTAVGLGMAHSVTQVPTQQWEMIREVIDGHGIYQGRRFGSPEATRKVCSRMSADLRRVFLLKGSCFQRYRRKGGWQARFRVDSDLPRRIDRD